MFTFNLHVLLPKLMHLKMKHNECYFFLKYQLFRRTLKSPRFIQVFQKYYNVPVCIIVIQYFFIILGFFIPLSILDQKKN